MSETTSASECYNLTIKLPSIFKLRYFELCYETLNSTTGDCKARCLACVPTKLISGSIKVTSNFIKHLKRMHPISHQEYEKTLGPRTPRNSIVSAKSYSKSLLAEAKQIQAEAVILDWVIDSMMPLSVVETSSFATMVSRLSGGITRPPSVSDLQRLLADIEEERKTYILLALDKASYVTTTVDMWSIQQRSFFGVTAHWIDGDTLERHSVVLSCERFSGSLSLSTIEEWLRTIHEDFNLDLSKVTCTITDNGSNFAEDFKKLGITCQQGDKQNIEEITEDSDVAFISFPAREIGGEVEKRLQPQREACASHILAQIATVHVNKNIDKFPTDFAYLLKTSFAKLSTLWNASTIPQYAETIQNTLGRCIIAPCRTRWNSLYDSVECILQSDHGKLNELLVQLSLPELATNEHALILEYKNVLQPIAIALEKLQGGRDVFYGHIIPVIRQTHRKLQQLRDCRLVYCKPILESLLGGLEKQFSAEIAQDETVNEKLLATIVHPFFKMKPILKEQRERLRHLLLKLATGVGNEEKTTPVQPKRQRTEYYDFGDDEDLGNDEKSAFEVHQYLQESETSLDVLQRYPRIRRLFVRFNCGLASGVPVERLFNFGSMVLDARNGRHSDCNYERMLVLRANRTLQNCLWD